MNRTLAKAGVHSTAALDTGLRRYDGVRMEKGGFVYIMASRPRGTLYIGVTSDLPKRAWEHRNGAIEGFTRRYGCKALVWYEPYGEIA